MYPIISSHRMPYDIDGTKVGFVKSGATLDGVKNAGVATWYTSEELGKLNSEVPTTNFGIGDFIPSAWAIYMFFPEIREITHLGWRMNPDLVKAFDSILEGSNDTTNGVDGTWETPVWTASAFTSFDYWRSNIMPVSFSGPKKCLRLAFKTGSQKLAYLYNLHIYGMKAAGQTPDDILFTNGSGVELASLKDWGDQPEGTTEIEQVFYIKNASTTKIANGVNLQLNHADFAISFSADGPWVTVLDISSIAPGSLSAPVYIKNSLGPPSLILGPRAARVIATVNAWV